MPDAPLAPPSAFLTALEGRAVLELASVLPALPVLDRAPAGDGHPVLVFPGWLAGDVSTRMLRWFLRRRGYHVHGWQLGRNVGATGRSSKGSGSGSTRCASDTAGVSASSAGVSAASTRASSRDASPTTSGR